jgi:hypothetical protein
MWMGNTIADAAIAKTATLTSILLTVKALREDRPRADEERLDGIVFMASLGEETWFCQGPGFRLY